MANSVTNDKILNLIGKLSNDWNRITEQQNPYHRIDLDIFKEDIRRLYDLVYAFDTEKGNSLTISSLPENSEEKDPVETILEFSLFEKINPDQPEFTEETEPTVEEHPQQETESQLAELKLVEPEVSRPILTDEKATIDETNDPYLKKNIPLPPKSGNTVKIPIAEAPPDLFSSTKTIADLFHQTEDNSLVAKMQNNKISDIKSVIGINDKFLFINQVFKGELTAYNIAINTLNSFETLEDALQFLNSLKAGNVSDENMYAFGKLTEIVKRRYQ